MAVDKTAAQAADTVAAQAGNTDAAAIITAWAEVLKAIGAVAWPLVVVVIAWIFRSELQGLIGRLSSAEVLGNKFTMEPQLDALENKAAQASVENVPEIAAEEVPQGGDVPVAAAEGESEVDEFIADVLEEAGRNPKLGLMLLSMGLDRLSRRIAKARQTPNQSSISHVVRELQPTLPVNITAALEDFRAIRNKIVHGMSATQNDIIRAIDSGIMIYRALSNVSLPLFKVITPHVELYQDPAGQRKFPFHHGVEVKNLNDDSSELPLIYPTRLHFSEGDLIVPAWNMNTVLREIYYRKADTGEIVLQWTESAEFAGEVIEQLVDRA